MIVIFVDFWDFWIVYTLFCWIFFNDNKVTTKSYQGTTEHKNYLKLAKTAQKPYFGPKGKKATAEALCRR